MHMVGWAITAACVGALVSYFYIRDSLSRHLETRFFTGRVMDSGKWSSRQIQVIGIFDHSGSLAKGLMWGSLVPLLGGLVGVWRANQTKSRRDEWMTRVAFMICGLMVGFGATMSLLMSPHEQVLNPHTHELVKYWTVNNSLHMPVAIIGICLGGLTAFTGHKFQRHYAKSES